MKWTNVNEFLYFFTGNSFSLLLLWEKYFLLLHYLSKYYQELLKDGLKAMKKIKLFQQRMACWRKVIRVQVTEILGLAKIFLTNILRGVFYNLVINSKFNFFVKFFSYKRFVFLSELLVVESKECSNVTYTMTHIGLVKIYGESNDGDGFR